MKTKQQEAARNAAEALANINVWASIEALLENSMLYGGRDEAATEIIKSCRREQQKELAIYDKSMSKL